MSQLPNTDPEWLKKMADSEGGQFVSVGGWVSGLAATEGGRIYCPKCGGVRYVPSAANRHRFPDRSEPRCTHCLECSPRREWKDDPETPGLVDAWAAETPVHEEDEEWLGWGDEGADPFRPDPQDHGWSTI